MAMAQALIPSPSLKSAFSPYTDSPSSPAPFSLAFRTMQRHSGASDSLAPPPSPYPATVDPSPVESVNSTSTDATDSTDIEEGQSEVDADEEEARSPDIELLSPSESLPRVVRLDTERASQIPASLDDDPQSVIHAPKGFKNFANSLPTHVENPNSPDTHAPLENRRSPPLTRRTTSSPSTTSEATVTSQVGRNEDLSSTIGSKDTAPLNTQVPPARQGAGSTPRASTQEEAEAEWKRRKSRHSRNLSDESDKGQLQDDAASESDSATTGSMTDALRNLNSGEASKEAEINSLKSALSECWSLCNTLANLSSSHRDRVFSYSDSGDSQEQAWKTCWKLCQRLYQDRDQDQLAQLTPTLELCRNFCQALFEVRVRGDEVTDSILRVSFELNNHLYNTHDRNLPDRFTERTLEFYLTMCHRLMKQRTTLPPETDFLLRSCWNLAELLFNLRGHQQNPSNIEEVLSTAVQACLELCDLFRESWAQARPDRGTPRQTHSRFGGYSTATPSYAGSRVGGGGSRPASALSLVESNLAAVPDRRIRQQIVPETPTTIFDDDGNATSPTEPLMPNILVLGPEHPAMQSRSTASSRWPSSASQSGYSENSHTTRSSRTNTYTHQVGTPRAYEGSQTSPKSQVSSHSIDPSGEDPSLVRVKALIVKAAQNKGYPRNASSPPSLPSFIKTLPPNAFGTAPWQIALWEKYRKLVSADPTLRDPTSLPLNRRFGTQKIAESVRKISQADAYAWIQDLYMWTFDMSIDEAEKYSNSDIRI